MNRENIETTIAILRRAQNFEIRSFQQARNHPHKQVATEEELHACGNTACIAGYVAVSQEWRALGGTIADGAPVLNCKFYEDAMAEFWGIPTEDAAGIIYGDSHFPRVLDRYGIEGIDAALWYLLTKDQAISIFLQMLKHGPAPEIDSYDDDYEDDGSY